MHSLPPEGILADKDLVKFLAPYSYHPIILTLST